MAIEAHPPVGHKNLQGCPIFFGGEIPTTIYKCNSFYSTCITHMSLSWVKVLFQVQDKNHSCGNSVWTCHFLIFGICRVPYIPQSNNHMGKETTLPWEEIMWTPSFVDAIAALTNVVAPPKRSHPSPAPPTGGALSCRNRQGGDDRVQWNFRTDISRVQRLPHVPETLCKSYVDGIFWNHLQNLQPNINYLDVCTCFFFLCGITRLTTYHISFSQETGQ